jgi:hypothetical protein
VPWLVAFDTVPAAGLERLGCIKDSDCSAAGSRFRVAVANLSNVTTMVKRRAAVLTRLREQYAP